MKPQQIPFDNPQVVVDELVEFLFHLKNVLWLHAGISLPTEFTLSCALEKLSIRWWW